MLVPAGKVLNYAGVSQLTPAEISARAAKILRFIDLGGHERYMKTALYGMTCMVRLQVGSQGLLGQACVLRSVPSAHQRLFLRRGQLQWEAWLPVCPELSSHNLPVNMTQALLPVGYA